MKSSSLEFFGGWFLVTDSVSLIDIIIQIVFLLMSILVNHVFQ